MALTNNRKPMEFLSAYSHASDRSLANCFDRVNRDPFAISPSVLAAGYLRLRAADARIQDVYIRRLKDLSSSL